MYRYTTPGFLHHLDPLLIWKVRKGEEKAIYLTFDDGPHPRITPWVLDQLADFNAKASFFCVGDNVMQYPEIVNRLKQEGHSLGNHTFNHLNGWKSENSLYLSNVAQCEELTATKLFRPPYGKIGLRQAFQLKKENYRVVMWTLLSRDYELGLDVNSSMEAIKKNASDGSIVLFHDSEKAESNLMQILPGLLRHFAELGFQFNAL